MRIVLRVIEAATALSLALFLILMLNCVFGAALSNDGFGEREWWLLFATAILPAGVMTWWYRTHPRPIPDGHCPSCGYDCRATRERCPECGAKQQRRLSDVA